MVPVTGLFDFQWTIIGLIFRAHERRNDEFGSLVYWMNWIKRKLNMWDMKIKKVKDFRKSSSFLLHLTDAYILAAVATELKVDNWKGIREKIVSMNWRKTIEALSKRISYPGLVFKLRQEKEEERDLVYENAVFLLQQGLVYRRFCQAIRAGDAGWIQHYSVILLL